MSAYDAGMNETSTHSVRPTSRRRATPEERLDYVRRYLQSGLSQQAFVREQGFSLAALSKWLKAARATGQVPPRQRRARRTPSTLQEIPLASVWPASPWVAELRGRSGAVLALRGDLPAPLLSLLLRRL